MIIVPCHFLVEIIAYGFQIQLYYGIGPHSKKKKRNPHSNQICNTMIKGEVFKYKFVSTGLFVFSLPHTLILLYINVILQIENSNFQINITSTTYNT